MQKPSLSLLLWLVLEKNTKTSLMKFRQNDVEALWATQSHCVWILIVLVQEELLQSKILQLLTKEQSGDAAKLVYFAL